MTTGLAWGICATLKHDRSKDLDQQEWDEIENRLDRIERAIDTVATKSERTDFVTRDELTGRLEELNHRITGEVDAKFECQSLSVEALRTMIRHTDSLLERVLGALGEADKPAEEVNEPVSISTE